MNNDWQKEMMTLLENKTEGFNPFAFIIKHRNLPEKIYKYRHFDKYHLKSLQENTIWMANPKTFNDPYDSYYYYNHSGLIPTLLKNIDLSQMNASINSALPDEVLNNLKQTGCFKSAFKVYFKKAGFEDNQVDKFLELLFEANNIINRPQLNAHIDRVRDGIKVCSFTTKSNNILMWSHYSDNHKGFCIEYDLSLLDTNDPFLRFLFPVLYSDDLFDATPYIEQFIKDPKNFNNFNLLVALYKSKDWIYENEWRYVELESWKLDYSPLGFDPQSRISPPISSVYMGSHIELKNEKKLSDLARQNGFKLYKMKMDPYKYKMVVDNEFTINT
jgi:hypothetical protein